MKIKLDDDTYQIFLTAAEAVSKKGIKVPVAQLAEAIINAELSGMDATKIAKRFLKSLIEQFGNLPLESELDEEQISFTS